MKLWDSMLKKGLNPDTVAYNFLIYGCCVAGKLAKAFELHDEMMRRGMKPNWATYYALSHGTCLKGSGFHEPRGEPDGEIYRGDNPNSATRSITC
ncbi:hypothetical protein CsSME_00040914 [Camellia sinensis var. sinensis]|uniref:putative pentatricopeptide repeat-containing protein At5g59900 n=1 Tax=Camellia sinensis TaxID=4442 RepID=UPI0010368615|nr:putative pentatricopeptide repeat-containing protein At5g59900 [Camellia sinensis]